MSASQIWLIAAIVLFILEIVTPGFVLANFAVASMASAVAAWLGASSTVQMVVFVIAALVSFVTVRPLLRRTILKDNAVVPTNVDALVGRPAKVTESIPAPPDAGRVKVDGDSWAAVSSTGMAIPVGTIVRVDKVDSTVLMVTPS
jgi:membrane protein implicated in regulation of membrane protease activity